MRGVVNISLTTTVLIYCQATITVLYFIGFLLAPIAQQVERIHGKDEVSGSNPDGGSSYRTLRISDLQGLLFSQIYIRTTPAAKEARQAPMATTISDFSKKPRSRATPKPITAAMKEPVEYSIAGNVIADRTVYGM